jgi:uncharacterized membrane protein YdjX (TVP38/TMEM64 family)
LGISVVVYLFRDQLTHLEAYGYLGVFVISLLGNATLIFPVPALLVAFLGGGLYNPWIVGVVSGAGMALGELTGYLIGYSGQGIAEHYAIYKRIEGWMKRYGDIVIFIFAAIPNPIFDLGGIAAGATGMRWWRFVLAAFLGKTVKALIAAWLGVGSFGVLQQFMQ